MDNKRINMANPSLSNGEAQAISDVLNSGMLAQGPRVAEFERLFADYIGVKHAVAVNNGTAALHAALLAAGVNPGDEVITTPFSFIATANSVLYCQARPVFADIDPQTFNIDPVQMEAKITPKTKAVIVVHLYGQPCDMEKILSICAEHHLTLIEDACQAHSAEYNTKKVGSFGTGCFSFYPTKNMTTGEGGMITTNDADIAERSRLIRSHGQSQQYLHDILGYNYRMTDIAAAIGICQLKQLDDFTRKRISNAAYISRGISQVKGIDPPQVAPNRSHVFHQYTIRVKGEYGLSRDELRSKLDKKGISTSIHYPIPIHKQPLYQQLGYNDYLPVSEQASCEVLSLPVHPSLSQHDLDTIIKALSHD